MIKIRKADKEEVHRIVCMVEDYFEMDRGMIHSKSRVQGVVIPRQIAQCLVRDRFKSHLSLSNIGELVGNKNHATILSSMTRVNNLIETEEHFRNIYNELKVAVRTSKENLIHKEILQVVPI